MSSLPNQIGEITQAQFAKQFALYDSLSKLAFRGFERLINLHMMTAKEALTSAGAAASTTNAVHAQPPVEKLMAFSHEVAMMSADMHNEFLQALRTAQSDEPSSVQFAFDGQAFNLPHFSLLSTLFTVPNEPSLDSAIETVIFKETKKTPASKTLAGKTPSIKKSKPKAAIAQTATPNTAKVSTAKKPVRKPNTVTPQPASTEASTKTPVEPELKTATAQLATPSKPSFPTVQRSKPSNKTPVKK